MTETAEQTTEKKEASCSTSTCCYKRPIPLALLGTAVVLVAGYSMLWFKQAGQLKAEVEKTIAGWNDSAVTGLAKEDFLFSYESLSTTGFPSEVAVRINKPKLHYTGKAFKTAVDAWAAKAQAQTQTDGTQAAPLPTALTNFPLLPNWVEDVESAGSIYLGGNYFSRTLRVKLEGNTSGTSSFGEQKLPWATKTDGGLACEVKLTSAAGLFLLKGNLLTTASDTKEAAKYIEHAACGTNPYELIASDTQESLLSSAGTKFGVYNNPEKDDSIMNVDLVVNVKDSEFGKRFNDYYRSLSEAFAAASPEAAFYSVKQASMLGKQNIDINIHYRAPKVMDQSAVGDADIVFKSFKINNGAMSFDWPLNIHFSHGKENSSFSIDGDMRLKFTKEYDDALAEGIKGLPSLMQGKSAPLAQSLATAEKNAGGREKLEAALANLAPRMSELGTIRLTTKAEFKGANPREGIAPTGSLKADVIQFMTDKYGIQLSGNAVLDTVKVDLSLRCVNCDSMVDDTIGYLVAAQDVLAWADPSLKSHMLDSSTPSKLKKFIAAVSTTDDKEPTTRVVTIKDNGQGDVRISGKGMLEVMMQWMQAFLPNGGPAADMQKQMMMHPPVENSEAPAGYKDDETHIDPMTGQPVIVPEGKETAPASSKAEQPSTEATPEGEAEAPDMSQAQPTAKEIESEAQEAFDKKQ